MQTLEQYLQQTLSTETDKFLIKKKESLLKKFKLTTTPTVEKLSRLSGFLFFMNRYDEVEQIGFYLKDYANSDPFKDFESIKILYIYVLKLRNADEILINEELVKLSDMLADQAKNGTALKKIVKPHFEMYYDDSSKEDKIYLHMGMIWQALYVLYFTDKSKQKKFTKEELEAIIEKHIAEGRKLLNVN